ncbi:MAG: FAD-dependent oxidoreductase [Burkholderiaceae bacterium]
MLKTYAYPRYAYRRPPEFGASGATRHPVAVIGAGPVGLCAAIDLAQRGVPVVLLDDDDTVSIGSRGVCYAKRTLEILDRLGVGDRCVAKGVSWNVGRTFFRTEEVFRFELLPEAGHKRPGMINLQQYYLEQYLVERAQALSALDLRWRSKVVAVRPRDDAVALTVETPEGPYELTADWLIVADGARSPVRRMLGLEVEGRVFTDRFLIADVVMKADFPAERWFWFDPPFHPNQSVLLHKQADNVWRIDFQLGWQADPEEEKKPERVIPRIRAMLGEAREFELEWVSVYTFQCRRMQRFRHGRVLFAGDAAHQVSPFGARGANSGIQDADNLGWKLALVLAGRAPERLLDTYSDERVAAADENLLNSTRSTDFITPKSRASRTFRDAVLGLARDHAFARTLVNSGRLSVPAILADSALSTPDGDAFDGHMVPGAPLDDAPLARAGRTEWLLDALCAAPGEHFHALVYADDAARVDRALLDAIARIDVKGVRIAPQLIVREPTGAALDRAPLHDVEGLFARRYDARDGTVYLVRPDEHVAARWRAADPDRLRAALARATCND